LKERVAMATNDCLLDHPDTGAMQIDAERRPETKAARPAPFPHHYRVILEDGLLLAHPRTPIAIGPPPQFGGSDQVWSPEDLLVGAVLQCLWTTFAAYARRDALEVREWRGTAVGVLDKGRGGPTFTSITLTVDIAVAPSGEQQARRLVLAAEENCIVSKALRVPVTVVATIRVA
jgi:organic hydroperoxide reductase OsmC/OhrA